MSNIRNHPLVKGLLLAWIGFFIGLMIFAGKDPFHWGDEDVANFGLGLFFLLVWIMCFFPILIGKKKEYRSDLFGCFSLILLTLLRSHSLCFLPLNINSRCNKLLIKLR